VVVIYAIFRNYGTENYGKEGLRKRIICKALVPGREEEIHVGLHVQTSL
jgi:hypothetical protein